MLMTSDSVNRKQSVCTLQNLNHVSVTRETSEDADSLGDASSQPDTVSIASRTSQNTADSDKVAHTLSHTQTRTHMEVYRRSTHCDTEGCVVHSCDLIAGSIWPCWVCV